MIVYQLVAVWRDKLGNLHKVHSKKVFLGQQRAEGYADSFKASIGPVTYFDPSQDGMTFHVVELEVVP